MKNYNVYKLYKQMPKRKTTKSVYGNRSIYRVDAQQNRSISKLKKEVKLLKKPIEVKHFDTVFSNAAFYNTVPGTTDSVVGLLLNDVIGWDSADPNSNAFRNIQREGNSITMKSLRIRGTISLPTKLPAGGVADTINETCVRMMLVQSTDVQELDLDEFIEYDAAGPLAINSPLKIDAEYRYKILVDKTIPLTNMYQILGDSVGKENYRYTVNIRLKFPKGLNANWKADTVTSPTGLEPNQNGLVLWLFSETGTTATGGTPALNQYPTFTATSRLRFVDN